MTIRVERVRAHELRPGDLFSTAGPIYWAMRDREAIGEKVYIRTDAPCPDDQRNEYVYRILIDRHSRAVHAAGRKPQKS